MLNRTIPPAIQNASTFDLYLKAVRSILLKNGIEVYLLDAGTQDVMQVEWVFDAGNGYEQNNTVAAATNHLIKSGTAKKTAYDINEYFEFYGAYLQRACYNETAVVSLSCLSKQAIMLIPKVFEVIHEASFPAEELAIYQQNAQQQLAVNLKKCDFVANRLIDTYLYGAQHPYGKYNTAEDYQQLKREWLVDFHQQFYLHGRCRIFVSGKLPTGIEQVLDNSFGQWPSSKNNNIPYTVQPAQQKNYRITNDANGVQGAIRIATPFPNRHHPDFAKVMVLNTLFGGFFGSRLMNNIREDKGYTYGIQSYIQNHIASSAWMISTEAGRDVCEATIQEVYKEMDALCNEPIDEEELALVRNFMIGSILGDLDGPFQIMSRWKNVILNGLTESYFYDSVHIIKTITAAELQALAKKYFQKENWYELVVI